MAGKQMAGNEALTSHIAGMSKNQLYDVMSQMKTLIEQNQQQAKQILVDNPLLTKALFQAQIMLGMVRPPQVMPNIQQTLSQQPAQPGQQVNAQSAQSLPGQASSSQLQISARQQQQQPNQPFIPIPPASVPPATLSSQNMPSHSLQTAQQAKVQLSSQPTSMSVPQSSNIHNPPLLTHQQSAPASILQSQMTTVSSQGQQSLPPAGSLPLQPPLPPIPRLPSMQPFTHQVHSQMGPNIGLQQPQQLPARPMFHSGANPQAGVGSSYAQGQPTMPNQPLSQQFYQVGSHVGADFGNQSGSSMQVDRGAPWPPGPPDNPSGGTQLPGPPPLTPSQMGPTIQPSSRPPQLTPEMEKALLQQVMSLTPEQINLLPPEQRAQVLQLQQMLR